MAVQTVETPSAGAQQGRECTRCRRFKSIDEFPWRSNRQEPYSWCFDCKNAANREYARRRAAMRPRKPRKSPENAWTPEEEAILRDCSSHAEMAARTGRSFHACRARCWRLGIRLHVDKWPGTPLEAAIIEAAGKRISFEAIAAEHGITRNTVAGIVWRWRQRNRS